MAPCVGSSTLHSSKLFRFIKYFHRHYLLFSLLDKLDGKAACDVDWAVTILAIVSAPGGFHEHGIGQYMMQHTGEFLHRQAVKLLSSMPPCYMEIQTQIQPEIPYSSLYGTRPLSVTH
jgi:hypothetical protein